MSVLYIGHLPIPFDLTTIRWEHSTQSQHFLRDIVDDEVGGGHGGVDELLHQLHAQTLFLFAFSFCGSKLQGTHLTDTPVKNDTLGEL